MPRTLSAVLLGIFWTANGMAQTPPVRKVAHTVTFFANRGQAAPEVLWEARGSGYTAEFRRDSFELRVFPKDSKTVAQTITLAGIDGAARIEPLDALPGKISFLRGSDPNGWVRGLTTYSRLRYKDVYPGIDLLFYGNQGRLEYDFVVAAGADPGRIRLSAGAEAHVSEAGGLELGDTTLHHPVLYQNGKSGKTSVDGGFVRRDDGDVGFRWGGYDAGRTLVIDPTVSILYATYLGGLHDDEAYTMAIDAQNNSYILGESASQDYPTSANAYQSARSNVGTYTYNMVITKMSPQGELLYSTFLGDGTDVPFNSQVITADARGDAWIGGLTTSTTYPVTANAYIGTFPPSSNPGGTSAAPFITEISPDGSSIVYSTFYSGPSGYQYGVTGIKVRGTQVYLAGSAPSGLPTTANAYLPTLPSGNIANFVAVLDPTQSGPAQLVAATYFAYLDSSSQYATLTGMVLDASGNPWITMTTNWSDAPTTPNAIQPNGDFSNELFCGEGIQHGQSTGGYFAKLSADMTQLLYGSFLSGGQGTAAEAGCDEGILAAATDANGDLYMVGYTGSDEFPVSPNAYQTFQQDTASGGYRRFVTAVSSDGTQLLFSTFLGVSNSLTQFDFLAVDGQQNAWIASNGTVPLSPDALQSSLLYQQTDGMVAEVSSDGTSLLYGTYLPQISSPGPCYAIYRFNNDTTACTSKIAGFAVDPESNAYIAGTIAGAMVPVTSNAFQSQFANGDAGNDGSDIFFMILGGGTIGTLSTNVGGNNGDVTVTLNGAGYTNGVSCSLVQNGNPIYASSVSVNSTGTALTCTFPLSGASPGSYDMVVNYPSGVTVTDPGAFTVQNGGQPQVWSSLAGRMAIRVSTPSQLLLNYGNSGTEDAVMTTLWFALPSSYSFTIAGLTYPEDPNCTALGTLPIFFTSGGIDYVPLLVPLIPAGSGGTIVITVTAPAVSNPIEIDGYAEEPWFNSQTAAQQALSAAAAMPANVSASCVAGPGTEDCLGPIAAESQSWIALYLLQFPVTVENLLPNTIAQMATDLQKILNSSSANQLIGWMAVFSNVAADLAFNKYNINNQCQAPFMRPDPEPQPQPVPLPPCPHPLEWGNSVNPWGTTPCKPEQPVNSIDPNDKTGPNGDGSASRWLRPISPFVYSVGFENQATATAPAAQVVITDVLDPTKVDLTTFALGNISFGSNVITVPPNTTNFSTLFPINSSLSVLIQGSLNVNTHTATWTFTSIDPSTHLPPSDPTVGFLPPDADGVEGQGSVAFQVTPKSGVTTLTPISNQASVVFDANAAILTPTWMNTIDATPPHSSVTALPAEESQTTFNVAWSGSDVGSGVASYAVYVSDDGGPFTIFQNAATSLSASFTGQAGHSYGFYSLATDAAGNVEAAKTAADTATTIVGGNGSGGPCDIGNLGSVTVADVQAEINEALGISAAANDLNGDGKVNAIDVQIVMNAALKLGCTR